MVVETEKTFGPIDLLVTSAGIVRRENHETLSFEIWKEIMEVNLDGTFLPVMALKDGMLKRDLEESSALLPSQDCVRGPTTSLTVPQKQE